MRRHDMREIRSSCFAGYLHTLMMRIRSIEKLVGMRIFLASLKSSESPIMIILILIASSSVPQGADCVIFQLQVARLQPLVSEVADSGRGQDLSEQALGVRLCAVAVWPRVCSHCASTPRLLLCVVAPNPI